MSSLVFAGFPKSWVVPHGTYTFWKRRLFMAIYLDRKPNPRKQGKARKRKKTCMHEDSVYTRTGKTMDAVLPATQLKTYYGSSPRSQFFSPHSYTEQIISLSQLAHQRRYRRLVSLIRVYQITLPRKTLGYVFSRIPSVSKTFLRP